MPLARSGRPEAVPIEPGRWRPIPLVMALLFGLVSVAMALTVPRPSDLPDEPLGATRPEISCAEARAPAGLDVEGEILTLRGHQTPLEAGRARITCADDASVVVATDNNLQGDGVFTVRGRADGAFEVTSSCFGCDGMPAGRSPREVARDQHLGGIFIGLIGVGAFLYFWISRPHDTMRDLAPAAPQTALILEAPGTDRLVVRGRELRGPRLAGQRGKVREVPDATEGYLRLPGAEADYRRASVALVELVGPGMINGRSVPSDEMSPVLDGDRVDLPGARSFTVSIPTPGRALRYLVDGDVARLGGRVASRETWGRLAYAALLTAGGVVTLHLDIPFRLVFGALVLASAAWAMSRVPPRLSERSVVDVPLSDLESGRVKLGLKRLEGEGIRVSIDGRYVAWLHDLGRLSDDRRRALHAALARELALLSDLPRAPRGSWASSS